MLINYNIYYLKNIVTFVMEVCQIVLLHLIYWWKKNYLLSIKKLFKIKLVESV